MAYVHLSDTQIVKVIINKRKKELVTVLPWQDIYKTDIEVFSEKLGYFHVELYPDCYLETGSISTFTKIKQITDGFNENYIPFSSLLFETIFYKAWLKYKKEEEYEKIDTEEKTKKD